jgi:hypothetical protein
MRPNRTTLGKHERHTGLAVLQALSLLVLRAEREVARLLAYNT